MIFRPADEARFLNKLEFGVYLHFVCAARGYIKYSISSLRYNLATMIKALIFDFDGLILDTETPEFQLWQAIYREHGFELPADEWGKIIGGYGISHFDPAEHLGKAERLYTPGADGVYSRPRASKLCTLHSPLPWKPSSPPSPSARR